MHTGRIIIHTVNTEHSLKLFLRVKYNQGIAKQNQKKTMEGKQNNESTVPQNNLTRKIIKM